MLLSQSRSVAKRRKDKKLRNKSKGKKKHKRLDAICENAYNSSRRAVGEVEQDQFINGGDQLELRRSGRARKAPVFLDSSPLPPKKRRKVDRSVPSSVEKVGREGKGRSETPFSGSRDLDEENSVWGSRLRTRGKSARFSLRERGESSVKGKRKLYNDSDEYGNDLDPQSYDKKESVAGEKSTVVKSKRPGRIKASHILPNGNLEIDLNGEAEDDTERSTDEELDVTDEVDGSDSEINLDDGKDIKAEDVDMASQSCEEEETAIQKNSDSEEFESSGNVDLMIEQSRPEKLVSELVAEKVNSAEVSHAIGDDKQQDERPHGPLEDELLKKPDDQQDEHSHMPLEDEALKKSDDQQDEHSYMPLEDEALKKSDDQQDEHPPMPLEDEELKKSDKKCSAFAFADRKPRIKLGRRCGLCGGGTDGKLPKILALEGPGSDNDAYSGSSASEEPNFDVWDGFGDQSGWLGRLLGPINDRFGIAGIWVHQQCAVWSPEVYFAGLGCLKNVRAALYRGRVLKCSRCRRPGATIGCRVDRCPKTYHLPCARAKGCIFDHRKFLIVCTDHRHLFQPHGLQNALRIKKMKTKKLKFELRKMANDASRKDVEAEEKWLENCGEDEEFLKRESKRLQRDLWRIAPTYIGGANDEHGLQFQGWESVAGLQDVIQCMKEVVILPLLYPEFFSNLGITPPRGVLLHGHPGTGKTLVVRALVGSCARGDKRIAYFARKGADCLGKYVGDAERQLRLLFQVAEKSQPSIIFFDEIDGLAPCRSKRQDQTHNSVVSTLLALMDGLKSRGSVIVIGATNRPDAVDAALRRPGRFDREVYFPLPSVKDRESILSLHTQKWPKPLTGCLLKWVAKQTVGFAGADLQALCTQAAMIALTRSFPLQEALRAMEIRVAKSKPAIHTFSVEERDWLKALLCAPPPCSRRESGVALNDVVSSPLNLHLVPCLLQPLTKLLVCLHLNENVWLPPHLSTASTLVKDVIVSCLDCQRVKSDNWWLHIDGLLEEVNVMNEIEKKLILANVLVGESNLSDFDVTNKNTDGDLPDTVPCSSHLLCIRPDLFKKMSHELCNKSGFQLLICGNPRSGQRHLASCLLHFFVGNVNVWKVDLASISNEGHGDMVHGLTRILMGCAQTNLAMLYLPAIDLWAIEMDDKAPEDCEPSSNEPQYSGQISCDMHCEVDMENVHESADEVPAQTENAALKKASYLWMSFVELVDSMRVNSSLIILATSELPFSLLPSSIRQFFGNKIVKSGSLSPQNHKVPQFSLQLNGKFDPDKVVNRFASKLSKDLAQQFVQSLHGGNHIHERSFEENPDNMVDSNVDQVCNSEAVQTSPSIPVGLTNKTMKVKSSLLLAISALGHQFLSYPHFAELCWVTSKLKDGPCADASGPWKGWPFNSCIVRPSNSSEKVTDAYGSSNIKQKDSGLVRGLVAVGLTAYRGKYASLREVCSEVREVLEILVRRINEKVHAGKDKNRFIRILSQVAYLDDMILSWAHTLQSLEVDAHISEASPNTFNGLFGNHVSKDTPLEGNDNSNLHQPELVEKSSQEVNANGAQQFDPTDGANGSPRASGKIASPVDEPSNQESAPVEVDAKGDGCSDPTNGGNGCQDAGDSFVFTIEGPSHPIASENCNSVKFAMSPDEVILECPKAERGGVSIKLSNGFTERKSNIEQDGPLNLGNKHVMELLGSDAASNLPNGMPLTDATILSKDPNAGSGHSIIYGTKPCSPKPCSVDVCFYRCCSGCFVNLQNLLLSKIKKEWEQKKSDSTVQDVHDFVASLSSYFHSSLHKLIQVINCCDHGNPLDCQKLHGEDLPESEKSAKLLTKECTCHGTNSEEGDASRFIFKDGVLSTIEKGTDISYHCKFEKLCLDSLIEWLVMSKEVS